VKSPNRFSSTLWEHRKPTRFPRWELFRLLITSALSYTHLHTHTLTLIRSLSHTYTCAHTHSFTLSYIHVHTHTLSLSLSLSLSRNENHTHKHAYTHKHTPARALSLSLSLSLSLNEYLNHALCSLADAWFGLCSPCVHYRCACVCVRTCPCDLQPSWFLTYLQDVLSRAEVFLIKVVQPIFDKHQLHLDVKVREGGEWCSPSLEQSLSLSECLSSRQAFSRLLVC
jgi:hypothetical protein